MTVNDGQNPPGLGQAPAGENSIPLISRALINTCFGYVEMLIYLLRAGNNESVEVAGINPGGC